MDLNRFLKAQEETYQIAFSEVKSGKKQSHWMWYIFPQIKGLGNSRLSQYYAIDNLEEAEAYFKHPVLGKRLLEISRELLKSNTSNAHQIFGSPDDLKLKSSMTLFCLLSNPDPVFDSILNKFFDGKRDPQTIEILQND